MHIGVTFPQTEFGADRSAIRAYCTAAVAAGYDYLLAYDHVLGADPANRPGWSGYTDTDSFHEVFTLFGYAAGIAPELDLVTGVLILPQRQTALVAKQAAQIDILTAGTFRLGVGVGWNAVEFEALGENFATRGRREEEQIGLLRRYWTEPVVTFDGDFDRVTEAGLNPMPIQRPIPIWIGGTSDIAIDRTARIGDGWFPMGVVDEEQRKKLARLKAGILEAGRDPAAVGIEARIDTNRSGEANWERNIAAWKDAGATHLSINTMNVGLDLAGHIGMIERFAPIAMAYR